MRPVRRSSAFPRTAVCVQPSPRATPTPSRAATSYAAESTPMDSIHSPRLQRLLERVRAGHCDVAVGSRFVSGEGYEPYRYRPSRARALGIGLLRRMMALRIGRPFADATSGMYAANVRALAYLSKPYESGAPEVESLIRLSDAGLVVDEVPVNMRERASGESKLRGRKAVKLVLTVARALCDPRGLLGGRASWLRERLAT